MSAGRVHQVLATLGYGDAIGHEVMGIQRVLQDAGYESEIFVETADRRLEHLTTDYREMVGAIAPEDVLIHHFSIGSRASRTAYALPGRMALVYHNITPPEYFLGVHKDLVKLCFRGRRELTAYIPRCELALGDSEYNRQELEDLGFRSTGVLPVVPDFTHLDLPPNTMTAERFDDGWTNVMFVGRVIPNKKFEDVIRAFHVYRTRHNPRSRLLLVGSYGGFEKYLAMLHALVARLGTPDVHFLGHVSNEELTALYDVADLFLCASEHEGFCVPLIESFYKRVPGRSPTRRRPCPRPWTAAACSTTRRTRSRSRASWPPSWTTRSSRTHSSRRRTPRSTGCWRDFAGTLLRFVDQVRATAPRPAPEVPYDFWAMFDQAERLEELRQFRPAIFRALPSDPIDRADPRSPTRSPVPPDPDENPPVGSGRASRGRDRRQRSGGARHAARDGARVRHLRPDDRRRPARRRAAVPDAAATRGDVTIFHFALPSPMTEPFAALGRREDPAVPQHHAGRVLRGLRPRPLPPGGARPAGAGDAGRARGPGARRLRVQPPGARVARLRADGRACRSPSTRRGITDAPPRPALERILNDGLINILFVGRIVPEQEDRGPHPARGDVQALRRRYYRFIFVGRYDGLPRYYSQVRALIEQYEMLPDRFWFTGPVPDERPGGLLPLVRRLRLAQRARGFLRAAGRGDGRDVPMLAYAAGPFPETLGGAGVLFAPKDLEVAAELLGSVVYDR